MPTHLPHDAPAGINVVRALLALSVLLLLGLLTSCGSTGERLAQRDARPAVHPRTVPADEAPLFPGLRKKSKRRAVASARPGARRPFTRGATGGAVLRKRKRSQRARSREAGGAVAKTRRDVGAARPNSAAPTSIATAPETAPAVRIESALGHERRLRREIEAAAAAYTGIPYVYGGTTTEGFDCSGYTQHVMREFGIDLKRVSISQAQQGSAVKPKRAKPGDLVYFANERGRVNHVGIVVSNGAEGLVMIHASSSRGIRKDNVTHSKYWAPRLAGGALCSGVPRAGRAAG